MTFSAATLVLPTEVAPVGQTGIGGIFLPVATAAAAAAEASAAAAAVDAAAAAVDADDAEVSAAAAAADAAEILAGNVTRAALVTWVASNTPVAGRTYLADGLLYLGETGATAISDLPGLVPSGDVTLLHFGAVAGGADASASLQSYTDYADIINIPAGIFNLSQQITATRGKVFRGQPGGVSRLAWTGSSTGLSVALTSDTMEQFGFENLTLTTAALGTGAYAIAVSCAAQISGGTLAQRTRPRGYFKNVFMLGATGAGTNGWLGGIDVIDPLHVVFEGCSFTGYQNGSEAALVSVVAYNLRDSGGNPAEVNFSNCWAFNVITALQIDTCEGVTVEQCNFVAVNNGIVATSTGKIAPHLSVIGNHINARLLGISVTDMQSVVIHGNSLFQRQSATATGTAVLLGGSTEDSDISGNLIFGDYTNTGGVTYYGVRVNGSVIDTKIHGNSCSDTTVAVFFQSGTAGNLAYDNTLIREAPAATTELYTDAGTNSINPVKFSAENAAALTSVTAGDICTVNLGDVYQQQKLLISVNVECVKDGSAGFTALIVEKSAGTSAVQFVHDTNELRQRWTQSASTTDEITFSGVVTVTSSGTLTLKLRVAANGALSISAGAGQLAAVTLSNSWLA